MVADPPDATPPLCIAGWFAKTDIFVWGKQLIFPVQWMAISIQKRVMRGLGFLSTLLVIRADGKTISNLGIHPKISLI